MSAAKTTTRLRCEPMFIVLNAAQIGNWDLICAFAANYRHPHFQIVASQPLPCDDDDDFEPDNPDDWREYAEDAETARNERADFDGWPTF